MQTARMSRRFAVDSNTAAAKDLATVIVESSDVVIWPAKERRIIVESRRRVKWNQP